MSMFARIDLVGGSHVYLRPETVLVITQAHDNNGIPTPGQSMLVVAGLPGPMNVRATPEGVLQSLRSAEMGIEPPPASGRIPKLAEV